jgi:hypothetical protein
MTPADERILKLFGKWRTSLELHVGYAKLTDDQYWLVQPWPRHQRPTAWVIQLALQRLNDLERIVKTRVASGDASISEALELMSFMANLVGAQNVERFVPIAEPEQDRGVAGLAAAPGAAAEKPARRPAPAPAPATDATGEMPVMPRADATREMPALSAQARADTTREIPALAERADATAEMPAAQEPAEEDPDVPLPEDQRDLEVVRDAVRLLGWGREWHELPDAIARMAGRPDRSRVRGILQAHRGAIERQAGTVAHTH